MSVSTSSRPRPGHVNIHESGDYPIILGESLKDSNPARSNLVQLTYNWEPKNGFQDQKGLLKQSNSGLNLTYQDEESSSPSYRYEGNTTTTNNQGSKDNKFSSRLVLIFDETRSAFVLEKMSTSIEMNLSAAPDQTREDIKGHRQIRKSLSDEGSPDHGGKTGSNDLDDETADPSNPYDFRHFLTEAKENAEKVSQVGSRTPIPGSGTPISRVASPSLNAGRFANTPSFRSGPTSAPTTQKRKPAENGFKASSSSASRKPPPSKRKDITSLKPLSQPLSKERISDSDEEVSDTITVNPMRSKGHTRNIPSTSSYGRSPHIIVNDGDLEIDMGSPPPERRRRGHFDPAVFRSQTHTPILGQSSNKPAEPRPRSRPFDGEDIEMKDPESSSPEGDEDDDVEDLELGSPQAAKKNEVPSHHHHQQQQQQQQQRAPTPPTPQPPIQYQDDDDDALAKELELALEEGDDDEDAGPLAGHDYGHVQDDESEVSEEE